MHTHPLQHTHIDTHTHLHMHKDTDWYSFFRAVCKDCLCHFICPIFPPPRHFPVSLFSEVPRYTRIVIYHNCCRKCFCLSIQNCFPFQLCLFFFFAGYSLPFPIAFKNLDTISGALWSIYCRDLPFLPMLAFWPLWREWLFSSFSL